ncbi:hypothetical protein AJ78_07540, partial [Emergomyces pasteurianus Ep9510]
GLSSPLLTTICTETKQLKSLVRNIVDPSRDLGHVDRALAKKKQGAAGEPGAVMKKPDVTTGTTVCKDCE